MKIALVCDNNNSWIIPYVKKLNELIKSLNHESQIFHRYEDVKSGDLAFFLGCETMVPNKILALNNKNLVVHESELPKGKGWSPLTWQILEGKDRIPITLFEANSEVDSGDIYLQDQIKLEGHELLREIKHLQGEYTIKLVLKFINMYPDIEGRKQEGTPTFYSRRKPVDSRLDIDKTIEEQFNLLRVVDNERYPAYFIYNNIKYSTFPLVKPL